MTLMDVASSMAVAAAHDQWVVTEGQEGQRAEVFDARLDLRNQDLRGLRLGTFATAYADLAEADLQEADLGGGHWFACNFVDADLRAALVGKADLTASVLRGVRATGLRGQRVTLVDADLTGAGLAEATLRSANLRGARLVGADLRGANLQRASLVGADLARADLRGADLTGALLSGARLPDVGLAGAVGVETVVLAPVGEVEPCIDVGDARPEWLCEDDARRWLGERT